MAQARYRRGNGHPAKSPFCSTLGGSPTGIFRTPGSWGPEGSKDPGASGPTASWRVSVSGLGSRVSGSGDLGIWGSGSEVDISRRLGIWMGHDIWTNRHLSIQGLATEGPPRDTAQPASIQSLGPRSGTSSPIRAFKGPRADRPECWIRPACRTSEGGKSDVMPQSSPELVEGWMPLGCIPCGCLHTW